MSRGLRVALIHNRKPPAKAPGLPDDYYSECDSPKTVRAIASALEKAGHSVLPVEADHRLPVWLSQNPVGLCFNIAEGFEGEAREARVPALLELLGIPYTGSGVLSLALALDKAKSKQIFRAVGIPTPNFQLFGHPDEPVDPKLQYPLIVKPNREGSAKGISASSVVWDEPALRAQVRHVFAEYAQEVLAEEYIEGTELTAGILGADEILPVLEIDFKGCKRSGEFFYSWRMKEYQGNKELHLDPQFWCPARLSPAVTQAVQTVAWKAARALGTRDIARVDIRLSSDGIPYVLEVNPLPGMDPEESNLPLMVRAAGIPYEALIQRLVDLAVERSAQQGIGNTPSSLPSSQSAAPRPLVSRARALPGSVERDSGHPDTPAVAVRNGARPRAKLRNTDPKEENLGR
ncbi:MAG: ATP-grasp domain-containing protein [Candidatus Omnitrophica bacterium]|nr:ATP-grasp domain-containing protein [Candidatus Omnitrophota bacterium]